MKKFKVCLTIYLSFACCFKLLAADATPAPKVKVEEKSGCLTVKEGKIKYLDGEKEIILNESYCFDNAIKSISSVKKCPEKADPGKECLISMPGPYEMKQSEVLTEVGSPGFNVCNKLKGTPQFIEYWDGSSWVKTSRCIFDDGSYMDIPALNLKVKYVD